MRRLTILILTIGVVFVTSACSASEEAIATSMAETELTSNTDTPIPPTDTAVPTETQIPEPTPTPLPSFIADAFGHDMVLVPAGSFEMGSEAGLYNESPVHTVYLDGFYIDKYEVTNQQYAEFLNDQGNQKEGGVAWLGAGPSYSEENIHLIGDVWVVDTDYEVHPVMEVTWYGAQAYCFWRTVRLPTEAEWEKAAKGTEGYVYPWGDIWDNRSNARELGESYFKDAPVGTFPQGASPYGGLDMAGNVSEWVADWFDNNYYAVSEGVNPEGPEVGKFRAIRGGSSDNMRFGVRTTSRGFLTPTNKMNSLGFRCASSLNHLSKLTDTSTP